MTKKIEELDFYDLLSLRLDATPREIENAYLLAVAAYHRQGLASYGALGEAERRDILIRIEEAYQTLSDPARKKTYDDLVLSGRAGLEPRARFRRSTRRLEIEDASEKKGVWKRLGTALRPSWPHKWGRDRSLSGDGGDGAELPDDFLYFGEYLRRVRERRGLSREEIADRCGLSPARIEALEEEDSPTRPRGKELLEGLRSYARSLGLGPENGRTPSLSDRFDE
jgi:curved DNA-binding protein CbpA